MRIHRVSVVSCNLKKEKNYRYIYQHLSHNESIFFPFDNFCNIIGTTAIALIISSHTFSLKNLRDSRKITKYKIYIYYIYLYYNYTIFINYKIHI